MAIKEGDNKVNDKKYDRKGLFTTEQDIQETALVVMEDLKRYLDKYDGKVSNASICVALALLGGAILDIDTSLGGMGIQTVKRILKSIRGEST